MNLLKRCGAFALGMALGMLCLAGCETVEAIHNNPTVTAVRNAMLEIVKSRGEAAGDAYLKEQVAEGKLTQEEADSIRDAYVNGETAESE